MPEFRTEPLISPLGSGLLPEGERDRRAALTSFRSESTSAAVPTKEVVCYECGKRSEVPAAALSANCIHCHAHLSMADVELKPGSPRLTVRTLGNVTVPQETVLSHLNITCGSMTVFGRVSGTLRCSKTLRFCNSMRVEGTVKAAKLEVEKGAEVVLTEGAAVDEATVKGRLTGEITAKGKIIVTHTGELVSLCSAEDIVVEPGGRYFGAPGTM